MMRLLVLVVLLFLSQVLAQDAVCRPFGECEPCPPDALHQPFCQPFGNRRLMHCSPNRTSTDPAAGETPAWQSCGRIAARERADFYEFVACNLLFAAVALVLALVRSRTVQARQTRRLAARIGLVRSPMVDGR